MQFISRDLDVFQSEFDISQASNGLAHDFKNVVLPDIKDFNVNETEYLRWIMVAVKNGQPVGYCYFRHHIQKSMTYIGHIHVDEDVRRRGVATKLMSISLDFIFSLFPNNIKIYFITKVHSESKLVDLFLKRATEHKHIDRDFSIEAMAYSKWLELGT